MHGLLMIPIGAAIMLIFDRFAWRQAFIILSASKKIGDWIPLEDGSNFNWFDAIKITSFIAIVTCITIINENTLYQPYAEVGVIVFGVVYLLRACHLVQSEFNRIYDEREASEE